MSEMTIAEIRKEAGFTQQEMADKLGISRQTYAKFEADPSTATIAQAKRVCEILGEKYQQIYFGRMVS